MLRPIFGLVLAAAVIPCAYAAQSFDNCTGVISSLPATISTQGTWCLKSNLSTAITTGAAITITTNNVTIDCNDYKVGGLPAGDATNAAGVFADSRLNTTVRNCGIRGFQYGIRLQGANSSGSLIENNRLDQNTFRGMEIEGGGHVVRGNRIVDTGGRPNSTSTAGIYLVGSESQITENLISGLTVSNAGGLVMGVAAMGGTSEVSRNLITGLVPHGGVNRALTVGSSRASAVRGNTILSNPSINGTAITANSYNLCSDNKMVGYTYSFVGGCTNGGNNSNRK